MGLVGSGSPGQDVKRVIPQLREPLHPGYRYNLLLDLIIIIIMYYQHNIITPNIIIVCDFL